jgi:hypothetical protein
MAAEPPVLKVRFTRTAPDRHRFEYARPDGSGEQLDLETHSFLRHDLVHFAVESEAGLRGSFYGLLAKVGGYQELTLAGESLGGEAAQTEMVVGPLQTALKADFDAAAFVERVAEYRADMDLEPIRWLNAELVGRIAERVRRLEGQWKATPFGETMELTFELGR